MHDERLRRGGGRRRSRRPAGRPDPGPDAPRGPAARRRRLPQRPGRPDAQLHHPRRPAAGRAARPGPGRAGDVRHRRGARRRRHLGRARRRRLLGRHRRRTGHAPAWSCWRPACATRCPTSRAWPGCSARWRRTARSATATSTPAPPSPCSAATPHVGRVAAMLGPIASEVVVLTDGGELDDANRAQLASLGATVRTEVVTGFCPTLARRPGVVRRRARPSRSAASWSARRSRSRRRSRPTSG